MSTIPAQKDLVLIGGGHAHVGVLANLGTSPIAGARVTLIARDVATPYSGMLPGYIAGHYTRAECHIDLRPLAKTAGVQLIHAAATGIDLERRLVSCSNGLPVRFDVLSIDIGSTPDMSTVPGAADQAIPVKPIDGLAARWERIVAEVASGAGPRRFVTVGGGAAGVEMTLAMRHRLRRIAADPGALAFALVTSGEILPGSPAGARAWFRRHFARLGIGLAEHTRVASVADGTVIGENGARVAFDRLLWVTEAGGAPWLAATGLKLDARGFIEVDACLSALGTDAVFAAGDIASNVDHPRPKAGVFAVRQGLPLAQNLRRALAGAPLVPFTPQRRFLTLISTGDRHAVAARGAFWAHGRWAWAWKDRIDRTWMRQYQLPPGSGGS